MQRIYLDSNVFISIFNREIGWHVRGLFVEAEQFLDRVKNHGHLLILSDSFFRETEKACYLSKGEALEYFEKIGVKTEVA